MACDDMDADLSAAVLNAATRPLTLTLSQF